VLGLAREIRAARAKAGIVIFSYLNPILRYGLHKFAEDAAGAGADGVLVTDLIVEEAGEYLKEMERVKLAPIFLAAPTSPDERLEAIAKNSKGFVYAISRVGITGTQQNLTGRGGAGGTDSAMDDAAGGRGVRHQQCGTRREGGGVRGCRGDRSAIVELVERSTPEAAPGAVARFIKGLQLREAALAR